MTNVRRLLAILVCTLFLIAIPTASESSDASQQSLSYSETTDYVLVETGEMNIAISKDFPAVIVAPANQTDEKGYGLVISSALGYNATPEGELLLEDVPYHASFEHSTWTSSIDSEYSEEKGETITVELASSVNMNKKNPSSPGNIIIDDWADVTVRFQVTNNNYSARYEDVDSSPDYHVNGTTELKFDIVTDINEAIDAEDLAIDIGLMMTEGYTFSPTSMPEPYVFHGYQEDEVTESNPMENETDGDVKLLHEFFPREELKQLFAFVQDDSAESYFAWAKLAELGYDELEDELTDISTFYRTDGDSLRIYLSTSVNHNTTSVLHDPSLGIFVTDVGYVDLPDDGMKIGLSGESVILGLVFGAIAVGAVGTYAIIRGRGEEDPGEIVSLEKNRYYRKKP